MTKPNDYVATAGAEKRLAEAFHNTPPLNGIGWDDETIVDIVKVLTANAKIEYKPRLKAIMITLPIPQPGELPDSARPIVETAIENLLSSGHRIITPEGVEITGTGSAEYGAPPAVASDEERPAPRRLNNPSPGPGLWTSFTPKQVAVPDGYQDSFPDE